MKLNRKIFIVLAVLVVFSVTASLVAAEDGKLFRKNVSKTPEGETEKAAVFMMDFYVPAQASDGTLYTEPLEYLMPDETQAVDYDGRLFAKPLVSVYIDDRAHELEIKGAVTRGYYDAFVGVSLDDGTTWKTTNLSRSADLSSFTLDNGRAYPGDVNYVVHQVFGDNIMVAWAGKYCESGTPLYSLFDEEATDQENEGYLADLEAEPYNKDAVYLYDFFGVGGTQRSVDYTDQGWPEVGEVPYSCIWTQRGKLLAGDDLSTTDVVETLYVIWAKPERLTSGVRDANLPAVDCAAGAGCMLTWQEDPDGLRPGQGLGPGEGWSGAVAWQQTDIWYSHINQADFDLVFDDSELDDGLATGITMADYALLEDANMPKSYVPMAMPARLTDNAMCKSNSSQTDPEKQEDPYCYIDFDTIDDVDVTNVAELLTLTEAEADADFCVSEEYWENGSNVDLPLCVTEDNRLLNGRVAATRVRMNLKPYTKADGTKSAWIVMAAEESKALGYTAESDDVDPVDIGKDVYYYSFDPFKTMADSTEDAKGESMVMQGGMLNQPAQCNEDAGLDDPLCLGTAEGDFYPVQLDDRDVQNEYYVTEIARRFALTTNSVKAADDSVSGLSAMLIYKQGIINQGGPADIMLRRVVIPEDFDATVDNPYAFENMDCAEWKYTDGTNPRYLQGLCMSPAINITGTTIVTCDPDAADSDACADLFPMNDDGSNNGDGTFPKIYEWRQCDGTAVIEGCEDDNDLDDQSWANPFDVAKGHRGFLDGDYVMMMYAWAPNWNSNTVGNDHYNLYTRRSFDGGLTWTTTPASLGGTGVTYLEYYYDGSIGVPLGHEWSYEAGVYEQGRNVSLLTGNKVTILDPRYSPTGGMKLYPTIRIDWLTTNGFSADGLPYTDDAVRDPSKFFMVYETGDNTTVAEGEATPLDLFYSRGTVYGDLWEIMDYTTTTDDLLLDRWPWLENAADDLSGEASMLANPGGTFMYAVWNQWKEEIGEDGEELVYDSDMWFRRLMYLPDDSDTDYDPIASWLYTGSVMYATSTDDSIVLAGTTRDVDHIGDGLLGDGIETITWFECGGDGCSPSGDGQEIEACAGEQQCNIPARNLSNGWHGFSMRGGDNEGNQVEIITYLYITDVVYKVRLPLIVR